MRAAIDFVFDRLHALCCNSKRNKCKAKSTSVIFEARSGKVFNEGRGDALRFFNAWRAKPMQVGALAPSSSALARLITSEIFPGMGKVLELGAGTGVFTHAILARGVRASELTLIESEVLFTCLLSDRFPDVNIFQLDATSLIDDGRFQQGDFSVVVSGLPLLSMEPRMVLRILSGAFSALDQEGFFYQFTYGLGCPVPRKILDRLGLKKTKLGGVFANFPPARVYKISRRPHSRY